MATKDENLRMQRVRWYRTRPMHVAECDFVGCGGCAPKPPTEADVKPGTLWKHYLNDRVVRVMTHYPDTTLVLIRALTPPNKSKSRGVMGPPRVNTAPININSFLAQYFPEKA